ncbi:hypothetical protein GSQ58_21225, partial [Pseudomonas stutzeri]|nr:hypothetical protein [Stutzerimonas stutzeri]
FLKEMKTTFYLLGLLNSTVVGFITKLLNPTINLQNGDVDKIPVVMAPNIDEVSEKVGSVVRIEKDEWDETERSWDMNRNILNSGW